MQKAQNALQKTARQRTRRKAQSQKETIPVYLVFERFRYSERRGVDKNGIQNKKNLSALLFQHAVVLLSAFRSAKLDMAGAVAIAPKGAEVIVFVLFRFPTKTRLSYK
ncbi:MAG: hypothetical protein E7305_03590 [Butyrivibrio sp.]|nr:hypothetical protein [Butyrivibrio sp.]